MRAANSPLHPESHSGDSAGPDGAPTDGRMHCEAGQAVTVEPGEQHDLAIVVLCSSLWLD
ncbi:hypothetical protein LBMAG42_14270 [Deltaproteobacteria bacterium]|nr:hypothetical protein LBMAG42_14270 [Deltaproteobacteria bacterium]